MSARAVLAHGADPGLHDWLPLLAPLALTAGIVVGLLAVGRPGRSGHPLARQLARVPTALERLTGIPGWAAAMAGTGLLALGVAVVGFYWDVAWHVDLGRDQQLLTPAHTMIVVGLALVAGAGLAGVASATVTGASAGLRLGPLRAPRSALAVTALGTGALAGFPLDELWHAAYGVDVTLWSPTHLLMVGGASLATLGLWLGLAEAGVQPRHGRPARLAHAALAGSTLAGMSTFQGEFDLGVPQFQLLYHPVLLAVAAGFVLVAARLALGPGGAVQAVAAFLAIRGAVALLVGPALGHTVPRFPLYLGAAAAVEAAALLAGTARRLRFALAAAAGVATAGLAGEWAWTAWWGRVTWPAALAPAAVAAGALGAAGAAVLAAGVASPRERRPPGPLLAAAGLAVLAALALPFPRTASPARAEVTLTPQGDGVVVRARLTPPDAARGARWFEVLAWQGGGLVRAPMLPAGAAGEYAASRPVPVHGSWKALLRLHRGSDMMAVPVRLPADPEIGAPAVPAADRAAAFDRDTRLLLREQRPGPAWPALTAYGGVALITACWLALLAAAAAHRPLGAAPDPRPLPDPGAAPRRLAAGRARPPGRG